MTRDTTSKAFFEEKYRAQPDPWEFASSAYEQQRYSAILAALPRRYERAFEPGCSIGILTARLAAVCQEIVAMDISPTAVLSARKHCKDLRKVDISCGALPVQLPAGTFDLIVLSEIGYYFDEAPLLALVKTLVRHLRRPGTLLAVHWLGVSPDHRISGDIVHDAIGRVPELFHEHAERHADFRLDRWCRT
jgi:SAM-dependent methyltransferase